MGSDTFTVYRVQPTPRTIANVESGRLVDIGSSKELMAAQQKGMTVEEFKKLRSANQGKWWSAHTKKALNYNKKYFDPKSKNRIPGSEILKRKVSIDDWIKGWKKLHLSRYKRFGKVPNEVVDRLNKEAVNMKKLFKSNRKKFLRSMAYANEAILDATDDVKTHIRGTWSINKGRAVEQATKTVGKGILKTIAGPAVDMIFPKEMGDAELSQGQGPFYQEDALIRQQQRQNKYGGGIVKHTTPKPIVKRKAKKPTTWNY